MTRTWILALIGSAAALMGAAGPSSGRSGATTSPRHAAVVASGTLEGRPWRVAVGSQGSHRKGICLQTLTKTGEVLDCAAPVRRRGIVTVAKDGRTSHGEARITVIASALNRTVGTLRLVRADGSVMSLHARPIGTMRADAHINNYRYLAKAVQGSLCVKRAETIGVEGRVLWQLSERELKRMGLVCGPSA